MFEQKPITDRIARLRERYRSCERYICTERFKLITEYYRDNPDQFGVTRRALYLRHVCQNIPISIHEDEIVVGGQTPKQGASALYPENSVDWLIDEVSSGHVSTRKVDPYLVTDEDKQIILELAPFWLKRCQSAVTETLIPEGYKEVCQDYQLTGWTPYPVGHFIVGHKNMLARGFSGIRNECLRRMRLCEQQGRMGEDVEKYINWRAMAIAMEAGMIWANRYGDLALKQASVETDPRRADELRLMGNNLLAISEGAPSTFFQAVQLMYLYQELVYLDAQLHGTSYGRIDQVLSPFLERDLEAGAITKEFAQEIVDAFVLKAAENNKVTEDMMSRYSPGYTSGQLITLGGIDIYGRDATNEVTFLVLQSMIRLKLHDPSVTVRIHKQTPDELWNAVIGCNTVNGGVPSVQNDEVIIPTLLNPNMGFTLEDARDYALVGCMEPAGNGNDWPAPGCSVGKEGMTNMPDCLLRAMFGGHNPMMAKSLDELGPLVGKRAKTFDQMKSMHELLDAVRDQVDYWALWYTTNVSIADQAVRLNTPSPVASAALGGCLESGRDATEGGCTYNSYGLIGTGIGNLADSLQMVSHLVFETGKCTAHELMEALIANWKGHEDLHSYILNEAPHFGNGDEHADRFMKWSADMFADASWQLHGPRGQFKAGLWSVTAHIGLGYVTGATPDGRMAGAPIAESTAPPQGVDKEGPLALLSSVTGFDQTNFGNGNALNMKFHPSTVNTPEAKLKLRQLIETYFFDRGGMQMQFNIQGAHEMKLAQEDPAQYPRSSGAHSRILRVFRRDDERSSGRADISHGSRPLEFSTISCLRRLESKMYEFRPATKRIEHMRDLVRNRVIRIDAERTVIQTESFKRNEHVLPMIKIPLATLDAAKNVTVRIEDFDIIVGAKGKEFYGSGLTPMWGGVFWPIDMVDSGEWKLEEDGYYHNPADEDGFALKISPEDVELLRECRPYWDDEGNYLSTMAEAWQPDGFDDYRSLKCSDYYEGMPLMICATGHLSAGFKKIIEVGYGAIRKQA